jgi:hypothetical protein
MIINKPFILQNGKKHLQFTRSAIMEYSRTICTHPKSLCTFKKEYGPIL